MINVRNLKPSTIDYSMKILQLFYFQVKTFLYLQWNLKKIAISLDNILRLMGQMSHPQHQKIECKNCGEKLIIEPKDNDCIAVGECFVNI